MGKKEDKVRQEVQRILTVSPDTRFDDMALYYHYVIENVKNKTADDFTMFFANPRFRAENGLATFASISRMRRKLQETYPELRPDAQQQQVKKHYEKLYRDFYKNPLCATCE